MRHARLVHLLTATGAGVVLVAAGCGSDDGGDTPAAATKAATTQTAATTAAAVPKALLGTYATTLRKADLPPHPVPELDESKWKLTIARSGGVDNGPVIAISSKLGNLESPTFSVKGDRIVIRKEECASGGDANFYDNEYRYVVKGDTLRFTTVRNQCPDKVAETILTSRAWKRASS